MTQSGSGPKILPVIPLVAFILLSLETGPALKCIATARAPSSADEWVMVIMQAAVFALLPLVLLHNVRAKRSGGKVA